MTNIVTNLLLLAVVMHLGTLIIYDTRIPTGAKIGTWLIGGVCFVIYCVQTFS